MSRNSFRRDERGQTLVVVALMLTALFGFVGLVMDIAWFEVNLIRVQRAADAAALAGVVYLPTNVSGASTAAINEATKNGYTNGANGVVVTAAPDAVNDRILGVTASTPVRTFFARLFGLTTFTARRNARAEFILPVPMASPQDYLGIYRLCKGNGSSCVQIHAAPDANGVANPALASQGFWAAVITRGGNHGNGDAYSTFYDGNPTTNPQFDLNGYSYTVELPTGTSNGEVYIFDPAYCAVGKGSSSGVYLGTGDHWIADPTAGHRAVTTTYKVWDTEGTPYTTDDDVLLSDTGNLFAAQDQVDKGTDYSGQGDYGAGYNGSSSADCQSSVYHNQWYRLVTGLAAGMYRVQVTTADIANANTNAENMFGIEVKSNVSGSRVYGSTRMCIYNNLDGSVALFYLAQIPAVHAGKTLEIKLFDPGDVTGTATLKILKPTSSQYVYSNFSFTANGGTGPQSGTNVSSLQTANGSSLYNNAWVTITIALPSDYGVGGLTPNGETEPAWWKIEYTITAQGNDTTTWEISVRGNPVHLITP